MILERIVPSREIDQSTIRVTALDEFNTGCLLERLHNVVQCTSLNFFHVKVKTLVQLYFFDYFLSTLF